MNDLLAQNFVEIKIGCLKAISPVLKVEMRIPERALKVGIQNPETSTKRKQPKFVLIIRVFKWLAWLVRLSNLDFRFSALYSGNGWKPVKVFFLGFKEVLFYFRF